MTQIKVKQYMVSSFGTNCYFAVNPSSRELLVIDPGDNASMLADQIRKGQALPVAILLTHGHLDHAGAAQELAEEFGIKIYAHEREKETLENPVMNLTASFGAGQKFHGDIYVKDRDELQLLGCTIQVLFTPGHTPGGCCYYFPEQKILFSGDTLFCQSMGRSDFPGGSASNLVRSIKEQLMILPEDVKVYPGHMDQTTIGAEKMYNPFL